MISIISPVYNGERFIESCINVVIEQHCPDVEHLIIDGGSKDNTVGIIQSYAIRYPHIRWISEPDRGQSDAMNKGIAMAKGEILGILNVDDYYEPNVLNRIIQIFKTLPEPSFLVGNCNILDGSGHLSFVNKPQNLKLSDVLLGWEINPIPANPSAYFYHTSLHQKTGLYDPDEDCLMDLKFILEALQVANVKYVNEIWGNFWLHQDTKTAQSLQTGKDVHRVRRILRTYRKKLPFFTRLKVALRYEYSISRRKMEYVLKHPEKISKLIQEKLPKVKV